MARQVCACLTTACLLLGAAAPTAAQPVGAGGPVMEWLRSRATPLAAAEHVVDASNLQPLRDAFRGMRVVGLGEATHGTREFFRLKHRIVQLLVKEFGYTIIGIEAPGADFEALNDYVLHGTGTLQAALSAQEYFAYDVEEFAETIGVAPWSQRGRPQDGGGVDVGEGGRAHAPD